MKPLKPYPAYLQRKMAEEIRSQAPSLSWAPYNPSLQNLSATHNCANSLQGFNAYNPNAGRGFF